MRSLSIALCLFVTGITAWSQTGGTMTGTVSDPAGAVIASAAIEARNVDTHVAYPVASSATGNYTIPNLPPGTYELDVTVQGFKKFVRPGLIVQAG